jgi:uncharacterized RDD family membrane protein YckC
MDEFDLIETPENVELERRLAGIGSRFMAGLVDFGVILAVWLVLVLVFLLVIWATAFDYTRLTDEAGAWLLAGVVIIAFLMYWGYFVIAEMTTNGQSPGKIAMRIRVVKQDGGPITFLDIAIRNILRVVDGLPGFFYLVGGITMFCTRRAQRLGDLVAGTVVVMEQVADYWAAGGRRGAVSWEHEASPEALRATGLKPEEYRLMMNFWLRRGQLSFEAQRRILPALLLPILTRMGQAPADDSMGPLLHTLDLLVHKAQSAEHEARHASLAAPPPAPASPSAEPPR